MYQIVHMVYDVCVCLDGCDCVWVRDMYWLPSYFNTVISETLHFVLKPFLKQTDHTTKKFSQDTQSRPGRGATRYLPIMAFVWRLHGQAPVDARLGPGPVEAWIMLYDLVNHARVRS